jgi:hypothetical protein
MRLLSFPLRLQENGLLQRGSEAASVVALLQLMARTPQGSWAGSPVFGLRDLFEDSRQRADTARLVMERVNEALADLQLHQYVVTEVVREISPGRDVDTYSIALGMAGSDETVRTQVMYEP